MILLAPVDECARCFTKVVRPLTKTLVTGDKMLRCDVTICASIVWTRSAFHVGGGLVRSARRGKCWMCWRIGSENEAASEVCSVGW